MAKSPFEVEIHTNTTPPYVFSRLFKQIADARKCFDVTRLNIDEPCLVHEVRLWNHSAGKIVATWRVGEGLEERP